MAGLPRRRLQVLWLFFFFSTPPPGHMTAPAPSPMPGAVDKRPSTYPSAVGLGHGRRESFTPDPPVTAPTKIGPGLPARLCAIALKRASDGRRGQLINQASSASPLLHFYPILALPPATPADSGQHLQVMTALACTALGTAARTLRVFFPPL